MIRACHAVVIRVMPKWPKYGTMIVNYSGLMWIRKCMCVCEGITLRVWTQLGWSVKNIPADLDLGSDFFREFEMDCDVN
jgi:hypothetical protein